MMRNDSSNMSIILAPNNYQNDDLPPFSKTKKPRKPIIYSECKKKSLRPFRGHCNTCYCRQNLQPPLLRIAGRSKPSPKDLETRSKIHSNACCYACEDEEETSARSQRLLKEVQRKVDYLPRTIFLRRLKEEAHKNCPVVNCGGVQQSHFTSQRKEYEELVKERQECQKQSFRNSPRLRGGDDSCSNACDCSKCLQHKTLVENGKKVSTIKKFRESNYFETHSATDLLANQEIEHRCVHKFSLDDRMVPVPENRDAYGVSRCEICNQPMVQEDLSKKTLDSRLLVKNSKGTLTDKVIKGLQTLEPKRLYVPMKNEKVEVKLPLGLELEDLDMGKLQKSFRPIPVSSMALRYQKRMI